MDLTDAWSTTEDADGAYTQKTFATNLYGASQTMGPHTHRNNFFSRTVI
jgi:hypothetical protein